MDDKQKNAVHIRAVEQIISEIESTQKHVDKKEADLAESRNLIRTVKRNVSGRFSNREMSLVVTKLQEADHWVNDRDNKQASLKLSEARQWANAYIEVLKDV